MDYVLNLLAERGYQPLNPDDLRNLKSFARNYATESIILARNTRLSSSKTLPRLRRRDIIRLTTNGIITKMPSIHPTVIVMIFPKSKLLK